MRLCRICQTRPSSAARARQHDYRCNKCRKSTPAFKAAEYRYSRTEKRMNTRRAKNKLRIYIGRTYHSAAKTAEQARRINAHLKGRLNAFKGQQSRAQVEEVAPDAVRL